MKKVTEETTFYRAIDGTKFFNEQDCVSYERKNASEMLNILRKEQTRLSREWCLFKQVQFPNFEYIIKIIEDTIKQCRKSKEYATLSVLYSDLNDKVKERKNLFDRFCEIRNEIRLNKNTIEELKGYQELNKFKLSVKES